MNYQIVISGEKRKYGFSVSKTGQLDYVGPLEEKDVNTDGWEQLESSTYFTPAGNVYLQEGLRKNPVIHVAPGIRISDKDLYAYILHAGALLCAVDAGDSLLAGELYLRRRSCFDSFGQITGFIIEDLSVEILFSLCFGKLDNPEPDAVPLIYETAVRKMRMDSSEESLEQALIRYFRETGEGYCAGGRKLTLQVVGIEHYTWEPEPYELTKLIKGIAGEGFLAKGEKFREEKIRLYEGLKVSVQAEPYNPADKHAVSVSIDSIPALLTGNPGLVKAGYIRAAAAGILRKAFRDRMKYCSSLARITPQDTIISLYF